jgi:hypothetical protein
MKSDMRFRTILKVSSQIFIEVKIVQEKTTRIFALRALCTFVWSLEFRIYETKANESDRIVVLGSVTP